MTPVLFKNREDCCGCKACANACPKDAISFIMDEYGFQYPTINEEKCIGCNKCVNTCDFQKNSDIGHYPLEGFAARYNDLDVLIQSNSGGAFTALAEWVINHKGIVYGCVFDEHFSPIHKAVESIEGLAAMRGSKYAQSEVGFVYRDVKSNLTRGRYVLFTGTPCQVAGLYSYLGNYNKDYLLTADLICHGVPNAEVFKKYTEYLEKKYHSNIEKFIFRGKLYGWTRPVVDVSFKNGVRKWWLTGRNIYYANFDKRNLQRLSCFRCKYACTSRCGDITIGDFWGFHKANIKMPYKEGLSCCLLNTSKAQEIFNSLNLQVEKVDSNYIIQGNFHLRKPSPKGRDWDIVMKSIKQNGFDSLTLWGLFYKNMCKDILKRKVRKLLKVK